MIGSPSLETQPLGDEVSGTESPAASLQVGVDPAGVNGLVVPQEVLYQPSFDVDDLESFRINDRHVIDQDAWSFDFIGKWFRFKDLELEDDPEFRSRHPSNRFRIHHLVHYDGTRRRFIPATVRYAKKSLYFICYSVDNVSDYELVPIKSFTLA